MSPLDSFGVDSPHNLGLTNYFTLNGKLHKNSCDKTI